MPTGPTRRAFGSSRPTRHYGCCLYSEKQEAWELMVWSGLQRSYHAADAAAMEALADIYLDGRRYDLAKPRLGRQQRWREPLIAGKSRELAIDFAFNPHRLTSLRTSEDCRAVAGEGGPLTLPGRIPLKHPGKRRHGS